MDNKHGNNTVVESSDELLNQWYTRVVAAQKCHYLASARYAKYNLLLGLPSIILSAAIGTTIFASILNQLSGVITLLIGLASMITVLLSSLQTFLAFNEKSEKHRQYGVKYGTIGRKLEYIKSGVNNFSDNDIKMIKDELDHGAADAPRIPLDILAKVKKATGDYEKYFGPAIDGV